MGALIAVETIAAGTVVEGVRLSVRQPPKPVLSLDRQQVVYELHVENQGAQAIILKQLQVVADSGAKVPLVDYEGEALLANMDFFDASYRGAGREYLRDEGDDPSSIGPGMVGVVFVWVTLERSPVVSSTWHHKLSFYVPESKANVQAEGAKFTLRDEAVVEIGPPLEGGAWWSMESMGNQSVHRRAMVMSMPALSQRYATDYIKLGKNGLPYQGDDPSDLSAWFGYGAAVLAVADAQVVDVVKGIPDNIPVAPQRAVPMRADTYNGNYVILDIGAGSYATYAHLAPGSIKVALGERVKRGQLLGLLGNSGNSGGPHLHFHIDTAMDVFDAEGLPYTYESFRLLGTTTQMQLLTEGFKASPGNDSVRHREIPPHDAVIAFPPFN